MWRIVLSIMLMLAFVGTAAACPWTPPQPPPPPDPPPSGPPPVPPEDTPPSLPPDDPLPPTNDPIVWPEPPDDPTSIAAPEPRTYSDGPTSAQKVVMYGNGVYEFYRRDNVRFDTHQPAVAVDHAVHERNEYRDVVLTPGQPTEYLLPVGLTYLFRWTETEGHTYVRTFAIGAPGADIEINLP